MINKKMVILSLVFIICAPVLAHSGGNPPGQPFQYLEQKVEKQTNRLGELADRFTPPVGDIENRPKNDIGR